jgi:hypothetical protein
VQFNPMRPPRLQRHGMKDYRIFFRNRAERRIIRAFEFQAKDDDAAVRIAEGWREGRGIERWNETHLVRTWEPD